MSPQNATTAAVSGILDSLRRSRALLLDPEPRNVDWCALSISQCVQKLDDIARGDPAGWNRQELGGLLLEIRRELSAIAGLLDSAAAFRRRSLENASRTQHSESVQKPAAFDNGSPETAPRVQFLG